VVSDRLVAARKNRLDAVRADLVRQKEPDRLDQLVSKACVQRVAVRAVCGGKPFDGADQLDPLGSAGDRRGCGVMVSRADARSSLAVMEPIQRQEGAPMWRAYLLAIPAGWQALGPVFHPIPDAPDEPARPGMPAALLKGWLRFRAGVLLCRPAADGPAVGREFEGGVSPEAAFLGQDGRYLQGSPTRPAYGAMPLAAPGSSIADRAGSAECLILLPLAAPPPGAARASLPDPMMFVDGMRVQWKTA